MNKETLNICESPETCELEVSYRLDHYAAQQTDVETNVFANGLAFAFARSVGPSVVGFFGV